MNVVAWILGLVLVAVFAFAGITKLLDLDRQRERLGYTSLQFRLIGFAEVVAAAGVLIGLIWRKVEWLGLAAGVGIASLMLGALLTHARVGDDAKATMPAAAMFVLSIFFTVFLALR